MFRLPINKNERMKEVKEGLEFTQAAIKKNVEGAEGVLISYHILKGDKLFHYFDYTNFPNGDWGQAIIAMAGEAKIAEMRSSTGRDKA